MIKFIDPLKDIEYKHLPLVVFTEDNRNLMSWAIRVRTDGKNHSMMMVEKDYVASQGFGGYKRIHLKRYMKKGTKLKFMSLSEVSTASEKLDIFNAVKADLHLPWYRNIYDFFGLIGQVIGIKSINIPWLKYCSERVASRCRMIKVIKDLIPLHPSPEDLNQVLKKIPNIPTLGYWIKD